MKRNIQIASVALGALLLGFTVARMGAPEGDASIYWVFAKSMWSEGFFYYGAVGPKHGATSPLWALLLSGFNIWTPDCLGCYPVGSFVFLVLAAVSTGRLARAVTGSSLAAYLAPTLLLLSSPLAGYTADGYETPLTIWVFAESIRATMELRSADKRPWLRWAFFLALCPLARPEGVLVFAVCVLWAWSVGRKLLPDRRLVQATIIACLPALIFFSWMWIETGELVPSSVRGRQLLRESDDSFAPPVPEFAVIYRTAGGLVAPEGALNVAFTLAWLGAIACGALVVARRDIGKFFGLCAFPLLMCALLLLNNPGFYLVRYSLPVLPIPIAFATQGLLTVGGAIAGRIEDRGSSLRRGGVIGCAMAVVLLLLGPLAVVIADAGESGFPPDMVLDRAGAELANPHLEASSVALVYEIQTQYYLVSRTLSADGVVGGEILPYLQEGDLARFIRDFGITHVFLSSAFEYRSIYRDTLLYRLWNLDQTLDPGEAAVLDGFRFVKILERPSSEMGAHWTAVYAVDR